MSKSYPAGDQDAEGESREESKLLEDSENDLHLLVEEQAEQNIESRVEE